MNPGVEVSFVQRRLPVAQDGDFENIELDTVVFQKSAI